MDLFFEKVEFDEELYRKNIAENNFENEKISELSQEDLVEMEGK